MAEHDDERTKWQRRGGQEPPPEVKDRPEQKAGYDEAVKGGPFTSNERSALEEGIPETTDERARIEQQNLDDREARGAAGDVRRRERSAG